MRLPTPALVVLVALLFFLGIAQLMHLLNSNATSSPFVHSPPPPSPQSIKENHSPSPSPSPALSLATAWAACDTRHTFPMDEHRPADRACMQLGIFQASLQAFATSMISTACTLALDRVFATDGSAKDHKISVREAGASWDTIVSAEGTPVLLRFEDTQGRCVNLWVLHQRPGYSWLAVPHAGEPGTVFREESPWVDVEESLGNRMWEPHVVESFSLTPRPQLSPEDPALFHHNLLHSRFLPCDAARALSFQQQYGRSSDDSPEAQKFKRLALSLLQTAAGAMHSIGVRFWISSGTLLGWFRQCSFIPHSQDVDFGVFITDYDPRLIPTMEAHDLTLSHRFGRIGDSFELSFKSPEGLKLDLFFFYKEPDCMWNGGTQARTGRKFKYRFERFDLCWSELAGVKVRVPCDTLTYIRANYGEDWFTPVTKWDWKASPPNVRENGVWPREDWPSLIQCDVCPVKPSKEGILD